MRILIHKDYQALKHVVTFNMDEYIGIPEDHPQSYHRFMWNNLFNHIDIPKENVHILDGNASDLEKECCEYEEKKESIICGRFRCFNSTSMPSLCATMKRPWS